MTPQECNPQNPDCGKLQDKWPVSSINTLQGKLKDKDTEPLYQKRLNRHQPITTYELTWFWKCLTFIYFWETECERGRGSEGEVDTESRAGSRLWTVSTEPDVGMELMNLEIMTWAKVGRLTNWATQAPLWTLFGSWFKVFKKKITKKLGKLEHQWDI